MVKTIIDYIKENRGKTFHELPFSSLDVLVLCNMTYPKWNGFAPEDGQTCTFGDIARMPGYDIMFDDPTYGPTYRKVFALVQDSPRYRNIRLGYFREHVDPAAETQFAAITYFLGPNRHFVAFRGTDGTVTGWKEDFNYVYLNTIPAEREAVAYLNRIARCTSGDLLVGGHSKGGTLAIYASAQMSASVRSRIRRVWSIDGMGFRPSFYLSDGYRAIANKITKIVPAGSLIGMIFSPGENYHIAASTGKGFSQHDFMNWIVKNDRLQVIPSFSHRQRRIIYRFNRWIDRNSPETIREFVRVLFSILQDPSEKYFNQVFNGSSTIVRRIASGLRRLPSADRRLLLHVFLKYL